MCRRRNANILIFLQLHRKHHNKKKSGEKVSQTCDQNWANASAASDKSSCFEVEQLLTLDVDA